jgi:hypothetical protein
MVNVFIFGTRQGTSPSNPLIHAQTCAIWERYKIKKAQDFLRFFKIGFSSAISL